MTMTPHTHDTDCSTFRDELEAWLAGEHVAEHMQRHHDSCATCRREAELARTIGGITATLPRLTCPDIRLPVIGAATSPGRIARPMQAWQRLLWRQPFAFASALAVVVAVLAWTQLRSPRTAIEPELVVIDGVEYTRDDIRKAAADLQIALRYLDRYRPARVISAELDTGAPARKPDPDDDGNDERRNDADAPTI